MSKKVTLEMIRKAVQQLEEANPKPVCEHPRKEGMIELLPSRNCVRIYCGRCDKTYKSKKEGNINV